jgi:hypothetical protein
MTAKTPSQRVSESKDRKRAAGLVEVRSLWAHREDQPAIRKFAADLTQQRKEPTMSRQITIKEATRIARKVHASVNRASDPRDVDWNGRIDALLAEVGLGWKLHNTFIDGLDCQFIGSLAKTIRANAVEKF